MDTQGQNNNLQINQMSTSTCKKPEQCPWRMADNGRNFTDYTSQRCKTADFMSKNGLSSYDHRQYLIRNADSLMSKQREDTYTRNMCGPCVEPYGQGTMLPEQSIVECNTTSCKVITNDPNGLGQGRKYGEMSAEEREFLQRRAAENKKMCEVAPVETTTSAKPARYAIPMGGI